MNKFYVPEERSLSQMLESAERSYKSFCETKNPADQFQCDVELASMYQKLGEMKYFSPAQKKLFEGIAMLVAAPLKFPYMVNDLYFESLSTLVDHFEKHKEIPIETIRRMVKLTEA